MSKINYVNDRLFRERCALANSKRNATNSKPNVEAARDSQTDSCDDMGELLCNSNCAPRYSNHPMDLIGELHSQ